MKIMRKLTNHPNVVRLHEVFEGENTFYFVMELSQGRSLYEEIKRHAESPFADDHVKMIIKGLLAGISYCSENKVMHRDLKPENLLFNSADDYKRL
jgi:calcium-dependent protein kinase